jgi:protease PrsW
MDILLLTAAMIPGLAISFWIYRKDKYEKEPRHLLLACFIWGCVSTIPAIIGQMKFKHLENENSLVQTFIFSFFIIALTEELSKFFFLRFYAYPKDAFNEPLDGIVYAVMVGMGFATLENVLYTFNSGSAGWGTAFSRALTAVPAHGVFAVVMGSYVGLAKFVPEKRNVYMLQGILLAIFFHGFYDFFLLQKIYKGLMVLSLIALAVGISLSRKLVQVGQEMSPFINGVPEPEIVQSENIDNTQDVDNQSLDEENLI